MRSLRERLADGVLIGDGAWGSLLAERGLPAGAAPEQWTLEHPEVIAGVARAYIEAGAEIVTTNTFGGSPMRLAQHHLERDFERINREAVAIVRAAAGDRAYVSASIGPTGKLLAPLGDSDPDEVMRGFAEQARILVDSGADLLCIETMADLREAEIAVRAARSVSADIPIMATMTFDITPRGPFTYMGVSVPQAASALSAAGADIIGANCGAGAEEMVAVANAFLACAGVPIAVQPNAGLPGHTVAPDDFARTLAPLAGRGIRIIGGCCGTTPAHIASLRKSLELAS
jgi:5-methyltetrahydrofolate--homocysteine methyltransferase